MSTDYSDYARDRQGWFFGLSAAQLATVAVAGLPELAALDRQRWLLVLVWLPAWAALIAVVTVPVRGWSATQWLLVLGSQAVARLMGWSSWQSKVAAGTATEFDHADLPGVLAGVQTHDGPPFGHP